MSEITRLQIIALLHDAFNGAAGDQIAEGLLSGGITQLSWNDKMGLKIDIEFIKNKQSAGLRLVKE